MFVINLSAHALTRPYKRTYDGLQVCQFIIASFIEYKIKHFHAKSPMPAIAYSWYGRKIKQLNSNFFSIFLIMYRLTFSTKPKKVSFFYNSQNFFFLVKIRMRINGRFYQGIFPTTCQMVSKLILKILNIEMKIENVYFNEKGSGTLSI